MKSGKKMDSTMLKLITAIDGFSKNPDAPCITEALIKIYKEMYWDGRLHGTAHKA